MAEKFDDGIKNKELMESDINSELLSEGSQDKGELKSIGNKNKTKLKKIVRTNPLTSLAKGLTNILGKFSPKKPIAAYGLGALMPPRENVNNPKKIVKIAPFPNKEVGFIAPVNNGILFNNVFFETLLMLIIIFWLLKWLFGFTPKNY